MGYIYKITNKISGKMYIGETKEEDVERRWKGHINAIKHDRGCPALQDAVRKYGIDNFKFEIVVICFDENRYDMEQFYIKKFNTLVPNGYNITLGGLGGGFIGKKHTAETVGKIKESLAKFKEENPDHFETYKEKHRESMKNVDTGAAVRTSEKFRKAVEEGRVGGGAHKNYFKLDNLSNNTKQCNMTSEILNKLIIIKHQLLNIINILTNLEKNSIKLQTKTTCIRTKDNYRNAMAKAVGKQINKIQNEKIINTYKSIADAARQNNIPNSTMKRAVKEHVEARGFIWQEVPKDIEQLMIVVK